MNNAFVAMLLSGWLVGQMSAQAATVTVAIFNTEEFGVELNGEFQYDPSAALVGPANLAGWNLAPVSGFNVTFVHNGPVTFDITNYGFPQIPASTDPSTLYFATDPNGVSGLLSYDRATGTVFDGVIFTTPQYYLTFWGTDGRFPNGNNPSPTSWSVREFTPFLVATDVFNINIADAYDVKTVPLPAGILMLGSAILGLLGAGNRARNT